MPVIGTLSLLLLYTPFCFRADAHPGRNAVLLTCATTTGGVLSRYSASKSALSNPVQSVLTLTVLSASVAALVTSVLFITARLRTRFSSPWAQFLIFPSTWTTLWVTMAYLSPVGYLSTWSVVNVPDAYRWLIPIFGPSIKDWIAAAWAVVVADMLASWYMGKQHNAIIDVDEDEQSNSNPVNRLLGLMLISLTIPSFFFYNPLPQSSSLDAVEFSTPVSVGCVNPAFRSSKHHIPTIDDFIHEIRTLQAQAKVLLLPEGAIRFDSPADRDVGLAKIRDVLTGAYVGVSFEETFPDPSDERGVKSLKRTGVAVISQYSEEPHLVYYKRHLVPFAESFSLRHSTLPPTLFDIPLQAPKGVSKEKWSPKEGTTRPLSITSSICLDFATPSPFSELVGRPSLILAPARTWDQTVGYSMWLQAKQRAEEVGGILLWCDGGEGGVSGVAGPGLDDIAQVGIGSFVRKIGVEYPFNDRRTLYAKFRSLFLIVVWLPIVIPFSHDISVRRIGLHLRNVIGAFRRRPAHSQIETPTNLLD
ncbi:hypothetical protein CVT24_012003 [Panaeolus cyanescens]|uniref:CN hydrolase domain-containing protein n=1 Tax=Panaeolus cyanescens TaxID=181874 RepID=A0A409VHU7_9AGAR|nr:hypothetical protein CVT24_012003 [Panaeolus cyanescens]